MKLLNELKYALGDHTSYVVGALVLGVVGAIFNIGYRMGVQSAYVPKSEMCEEYILKVAELDSSVTLCETQRAKEVLECKTNCVSKVCRPLCIQDVKKGIENYKKLRKCK